MALPGIDLAGVDFGARIAASALLVLAFVAVAWLGRRFRARDGIDTRHRILNAALAVMVLGVGTGVSLSLLALWDISAFDLLGIQDPVRVATRAVLTLVVLIGAYLLTGVVKRFVYELTEDRQAITQHQTELTFRLTQVILYILAVIVVFGLWEQNLGGLLVGAGFLGIVVGLAARQTLGSLIAGFVLMFARPFEIGDWVEIGQRQGIVTEISIVNTRIQTPDGEYVMVPNDNVASSEIVNRTRKGRLRLRVEVGVDYGTDVPRAAEVAKEAIDDIEEVLTVPRPQVVATEFADSAILLELRFWIDKPSARRRARAQSAVIREVKAAFDREGIKIPFPQRELSGRAETGGFRVRSGTEAETGATPDRGADGSG